MRLITAAILVAGLVTGAGAQTAPPAAKPAQGAMPKELAALQGTWQVVTMNGASPSDQGAEIAFVMKANTYQVVINGATDESGTFKIDATKKPIWFDLSIVKGDDAGKVQQGIIAIGTDTIDVAFSAPGDASRPTDVKKGVVTFTAKKKQ